MDIVLLLPKSFAAVGVSLIVRVPIDVNPPPAGLAEFLARSLEMVIGVVAVVVTTTCALAHIEVIRTVIREKIAWISRCLFKADASNRAICCVKILFIILGLKLKGACSET
jgi:hypothetical protein